MSVSSDCFKSSEISFEETFLVSNFHIQRKLAGLSLTNMIDVAYNVETI